VGNACHRLGLVRHKSHVNGHIAVFGKEAEGQSKVVLAAVDPTPDAVIDMMLAAAHMHDGQTVLEPSAGIGSICDRVKQAFPHTDLDAVELRDSLTKILVAKGHAVVGRDFTAWNGNGRQSTTACS
jgi:phospholipid N-methyltransferase